MPMLILKYKLPEENSEALLAQNAGKLYSICHEISNYARTLDRYDERKSIKKEEIVDKLRELLYDYNVLEIE